MDQWLQVAGAVTILIAYVLQQAGTMRSDSRCYLWLNLTGAAVLAWLAWKGSEWGFLLRETVWAGVTAVSLARRAKSAAPAP